MKSIQFTNFEDWKDTEGIISSIGNSLKKMGITLAENPIFEGTDGYSFILLKEDYNKEDLYQELRENIMIDKDIQEIEMDVEEIEEMINREADYYFKEITGEHYS